MGALLGAAMVQGTVQADTFSVVDVETTGLFPEKHDRVVEIAIVTIKEDGFIADEYTTLVNPLRDIGPTAIHGIRASDVVAAPTFADIVGDVLDRLSGCTLAAHNAQFELMFLAAEMSRAGVHLPDVPWVCTLELSARLLPGAASRRLEACCQAVGIPCASPHMALEDARAAAQLLAILISWDPSFERDQQGEPLPPRPFNHIPRTGRVYPRTAADVAFRGRQQYLARLVSQLPLMPTPLRSDRERARLAYLHLLDRSLEDRWVTPEEAEALMGLAQGWGLSADDVRQIHNDYLGDLAAAALADGVVSAAERDDLRTVTAWLGLEESALEQVLLSQHARVEQHSETERENLAGKSVCFTGKLTCTIRGQPISREMANRLAASAGLEVKSGVSKKLDLLVTADPLTLSGKGRKAREYGTRIVAENLFWQMVGVQVD